MENVCFEIDGWEIIVDKTIFYCSKKYIREYINDVRIQLACVSVHHFKQFVDFIGKRTIPADCHDQTNLYCLLQEWECNDFCMNYFQQQTAFFEYDGVFMFNQKLYNVNLGSFIKYSSVFKNFYYSYPEQVFCLRNECSETSFLEFLDVIHERKRVHNIEEIHDVYLICQELVCSSLINLFNPSTVLIEDLIHERDGFDHMFSLYERIIESDLRSLIHNQEFSRVPISTLVRIFQKHDDSFSFSELRLFFEGCIKHHGSSSQYVFDCVKLKNLKSEEIDDFETILSMKSNNYHSLYSENIDHTNKILEKTQKELKETKDKCIQRFVSSIFFSANFGVFESVELLCKKKKSVNSKDHLSHEWHRKGNTALHYASYNGHQSIVEHLLLNQAEVNSKNDRAMIFFLKTHHYIVHVNVVIFMLLNI